VNDFNRLAKLFDACPGDNEAHVLFAAAFGMWPARHAHKPPLDGEEQRTTTSWLDAEPTDVEPSLRTRGDTATRGRAPRVGDPTAVRRDRRRQQAASLADQRRVQAALDTDGLVRISTLASLDRDQFAELLRLLASALNTQRRSDGSFRSESPDGAVEVILTETDGAGQAVIETEFGTFRTPDMAVSIQVDGVDQLKADSPVVNAGVVPEPVHG